MKYFFEFLDLSYREEFKNIRKFFYTWIVQKLLRLKVFKSTGGTLTLFSFFFHEFFYCIFVALKNYFETP